MMQKKKSFATLKACVNLLGRQTKIDCYVIEKLFKVLLFQQIYFKGSFADRKYWLTIPF